MHKSTVIDTGTKTLHKLNTWSLHSAVNCNNGQNVNSFFFQFIHWEHGGQKLKVKSTITTIFICRYGGLPERAEAHQSWRLQRDTEIRIKVPVSCSNANQQLSTNTGCQGMLRNILPGTMSWLILGDMKLFSGVKLQSLNLSCFLTT